VGKSLGKYGKKILPLACKRLELILKPSFAGGKVEIVYF
jgi:hypothetical protein